MSVAKTLDPKVLPVGLAASCMVAALGRAILDKTKILISCSGNSLFDYDVFQKTME